MSVNEELSELKETVAEHRGKVDEFIVNTIGYRKDLCKKLDNITSVLTGLPCKERAGKYAAFDRQMRFMWAVLAILLGLAVKNSFDNVGTGRSLAVLKQGVVAEAAQCVKQEIQNEKQNKYNARNEK